MSETKNNFTTEDSESAARELLMQLHPNEYNNDSWQTTQVVELVKDIKSQHDTILRQALAKERDRAKDLVAALLFISDRAASDEMGGWLRLEQIRVLANEAYAKYKETK